MHRFVLGLMLCMFSVVPAYATVDWDEGFEYSGATVQDMYNSMTATNWVTSCGSNSVVIAPTTQALAQAGAPAPHGGTRMLEERFRGHQGVTPGYQSCFIDRILNSATTGTLYSRFFVYIPNSFVMDPTVTKITLHPSYAGDSYTSVWWDFMWGSTQIGANIQKVWSPPVLNDQTEIIYGGFVPRNQWVCVETRITYATPGQQNGIVQLWINEAQSINRTNVWMDQTGQQSVFRSIRLYTQDGTGQLYYDDYAVSRDARIGCSGVAPPPPTDTTAPTVPTGVAASSTVPLQNNVGWTASTDASSPITYTVLYCTPSPCTPSLTAGGTTSTGLPHAGLTGGASYVYAVVARDPNGNTSATSSTATTTVLSAGGATSLTINANGLAVINGTQTFLQSASYMDGGQNWHATDIDQLSTLGYNNIRVFANYAEDTYGGARSVCTVDGSLNTTRRDELESLLDYTEAINMTVTLIYMSEQTNTLIPVDANKQTCVTNLTNAYKHHPLLLIDINNEHMEAGNSWINSTSEYATYHNLVKAAWPEAIVFASATSPYSHPQDTSDSIVSSYIDGMTAAGVPLLAWHDYRSSNWDLVTGSRVTTIKNYLASIGKPSVGVFFTEPCRIGYSAECDATSASGYLSAAVRARDAGAMGWVWHHGYFDFSALSLFAQLDATNLAIANGLSSALANPTDEVPVLVETCTFSGVLTDCMYAGIETNETPVIVSGQLQAASTSNQSVAVYDGQGATIPTINQGLTVEQTVVRDATPLYMRIGVRMQAGTDYSGYDCRFTINSSPPDTVELYRKDNDNPVLVAGPLSVTLDLTKRHGCWAYGSTFWATEGDDVSTQTTLLGGSDPTYSSGLPFLYLGTFGPATTALKMDNARVYEFGPPAPPCTPSISQVVASSTGATVTYDTACPPAHILVDTELDTQTLSLSSFPSGVYTRPGGWKLGENFTCMRAIDAQGVVNDTTYGCDGVSEFVPNPDNSVPVMTFTGPTGELPNGTTSAVTSLTTDEAASCRWATTNIAYTAMTNNTNDFGLSHSFTATGLGTGANTFYVQCRDQAPQPNTTSTALTITVTVAAATVDTTAPSTVTNLVATAISASQISITHDLATDAGGSPSYAAYISQDGSTYGLAVTYTGVPQTISGLSPGTLYYIKVLSIDPSLNPAAAYSNVATATTTATPDTELPSDPAGLVVTGAFTQSITVAWTPGTDNKGTVNTAVEVCTGSFACTAFSLRGTTSGNTYTVTGLTPSTNGQVRIKHIDGSGNVSANYSARVPFTTAATGTVLPRAPVSFSQPRLPRN